MSTESGSVSAETLLQRRAAESLVGMLYDGDRDVYETLGYDRNIRPQQYRDRYERQDMAAVVVDTPAQTAWRSRPLITDQPTGDQSSATDSATGGGESHSVTAFERGIDKLFDSHRLLHYLQRADRVAGIGRFGVLVIGFADGEDASLDQPPDPAEFTGDPEEDIGYFATFDETAVEVDVETDPRSDRYGKPTSYDITFDTGGGNPTEETVHWSRVIHIAENVLDNEVYGRSRMKQVWNRLLDLEKVVGSSAEMFWRGADRKFVANSKGEQIVNKEEMQKEVEKLIHDLDNVAYLRNVELEAITGDSPDPSGVAELIITIIAGKTGIPQRILTGSERGELASTQDRATFYGRIAERQQQFCEPVLLRALIDRLIKSQILPTPIDEIDAGFTGRNGHDEAGGSRYRAPGDSGAYRIEWPTLFELNEVEQAEVEATRAQALNNASMGDPLQIASVEEIRSEVFGWSPERGSEAPQLQQDVGQSGPIRQPATPTPEAGGGRGSSDDSGSEQGM